MNDKFLPRTEEKAVCEGVGSANGDQRGQQWPSRYLCCKYPSSVGTDL